MEQPGLDNRHRDKNGQIARKHGDTLSHPSGRLAMILAADRPEDAEFVDVLPWLDEPSLTKPVHDVHGAGGNNLSARRAASPRS
jgi:hypothetical protein